MSYDPENLFAKIIRGEIPCHKIFETEHVLAILDNAGQSRHAHNGRNTQLTGYNG